MKNITFVDSGKVSPSNPVRQSLFRFEDEGKYKALAAAEELKRIRPDINSLGLVLTIPMPGHFVLNEAHGQEIVQSVIQLDKLVQEHDVLYLLTDSRESRWFPTLLANTYEKVQFFFFTFKKKNNNKYSEINIMAAKNS